METIKYWWKTIIWHPLDVADRIIVLVGAIASFLQKGDDPVTVALAWQIPVGTIIVFLMSAPIKETLPIWHYPTLITRTLFLFIALSRLKLHLKRYLLT